MAENMIKQLVEEMEFIFNDVTFGVEIESLRKPFTIIDARGMERRNWIQHIDNSVGGGRGYEAVSPRMTLDSFRKVHHNFIQEFLPQVQPTLTAGTHVHVGIWTLLNSEKQGVSLAKEVLKFWMKHEKRITHLIARRHEDRAKWVKMTCYHGFGKKAINILEKYDNFYSVADAIEYRGRYHTLNLYSLYEHGTLEFRVWNSTQNMEYIRKSIFYSLGIVAYCFIYKTFPKAFKEEDFLNFDMFLDAISTLEDALLPTGPRNTYDRTRPMYDTTPSYVFTAI